MRNTEELVASLHLRMERKRQKRERRRTSAVGMACVGLSICLIVLVFGGGLHPVGTAGVYSGASILFEDAGGYVLIAIPAFMLGVAATVIFLRQRNRGQSRTDQETKQENQKPERN